MGPLFAPQLWVWLTCQNADVLKGLVLDFFRKYFIKMLERTVVVCKCITTGLRLGYWNWLSSLQLIGCYPMLLPQHWQLRPPSRYGYLPNNGVLNSDSCYFAWEIIKKSFVNSSFSLVTSTPRPFLPVQTCITTRVESTSNLVKKILQWEVKK